ncbi:Pentatricopeptide repeat-containing protein, partial [Durusdinium trenchii]
WGRALELLERLERQSLEVSHVSLGVMMKASHSWWRVLRKMQQMLEKGMSLEIRHANELIRSCKGETWPKVLSALQMSLERGAEPTEFTSSLVLAKLKQQWPLAIHLFHDLAHQRLQHDTVSVNAALVAANQERRYSKNFVNEQLTSASAVDSATCSTVAQGGHDSETVLELLQRMKA